MTQKQVSERANPSFLGFSNLSIREILYCFEAEAVRFAEIINSPLFLSAISQYLRPGDNDDENARHKIQIPRALREQRIVDINQYADWQLKVLAPVQVAVCCDLFQGCTVSLDRIDEDAMRHLAASIVDQTVQSKGDEATPLLTAKLQVVDTVRTVQLLRNLGLITRSAHTTQQLSLGAGSGIRDVDAMHAALWLQNEYPSNAQQQHIQERRVSFNAEFPGAKHVILVDSALEHAELYESLNQRSDNNILAINQEISPALSQISEQQQTGELEKRNLVVGYRIDHRMIPDVPLFFSMLSGIIEEAADCIITIGAGNDINEFEGRVNKIIEISEFLERLGLNPVRIKMYRGNNFEEQRCNPLFGISQIVSYEILYCKLKRKRLIKGLKQWQFHR